MYKRYPRALFLVLALFACSPVVPPAFAQAEPPTNPENGSVQGTVVNSVTHEAIGRALVYSPDNRWATMTDSEGHFAFTLPAASSPEENPGTNLSGNRVPNPGPSRPETLEARKPGFLGSGRMSLGGDKELTLSLTPEAVITGRVVLPSSEAPDKIRVQLYRRWVDKGRAYWQSVGTATTRSNGEFRFADLSSGTYKLLTRELQDNDPLSFDPHGQLYGYPPVYFPNAQDFASAQTIQLVAGQSFQGAEVSLVRQAYYPVKVAVENVPTGRLMSLSVYAEGRGPGFELGYNRREHAIMGTLPNGNYTLEMSTFGPEELNAVTGILNITVKGGPVEGARMVAVPNGSIRVAVTEEFTAGEGLNARSPNSQHLASNPGSEETLQGPSDYLNIGLEPADDVFDQGRQVQAAFAHGRAALRRAGGEESLVIENVSPGRYWIQIDSRRGFPALIRCGGVDLERQPLVIGAGGSNLPIELTMRDDGADVEGTVEGLAQTPGETEGSAVLYLVPLPDGGGDYRETRVSPEGKFNLQQVPPGLYQALAFDHAQPPLEYRNAEIMRGYESKGQVVRLLPGQKEQLRVQVISTSE